MRLQGSQRGQGRTGAFGRAPFVRTPGLHRSDRRGPDQIQQGINDRQYLLILFWNNSWFKIDNPVFLVSISGFMIDVMFFNRLSILGEIRLILIFLVI
ncbi:MAG: hypothetical protein ACFFFG_18350 [Candidatus Thorarchaeota archaeon]